MRVIAGKARRIQLKSMEGMKTRPTTDRIKETLFNMLSQDIYGCHFLDLFSGSGAIAIEALSRGASRCVFVDSSQRSIRAIYENLRTTKLEKYSEVINRDSYDYIKHTARSFDIIILDPPYRHNHIDNILPFAAAKLNDGGFIVCEYEKEADEPAVPEGLVLRKTYKYGKISVTILSKSFPEDEEE